MEGSFLQSREWEEFQRAVGRRVWRIDDTLVIRHELPLGMNYLYCPRPLPESTKHEARSTIFEKITEIAKKEKSIFLKIDPMVSIEVSGLRFRASESLQPRQTVILDLQKSEEELVAGMHEKTRYNIRLAGRRGVEINNFQNLPTRQIPGLRPSEAKQFASDSISNFQFETFWKLLQETAARDGFHTHERTYYEKLLAVGTNEFSNGLFFAEYEGEVLAAAMINFYHPSRTATYLHGASARSHREVMAPHMLHWEIARDAKNRGFAHYDFWGIDEKKWPGVTRFKRGFGGREVSYPVSADIVFRPWLYRAYCFARRLKRT